MGWNTGAEGEVRRGIKTRFIITFSLRTKLTFCYLIQMQVRKIGVQEESLLSWISAETGLSSYTSKHFFCASNFFLNFPNTL